MCVCVCVCVCVCGTSSSPLSDLGGILRLQLDLPPSALSTITTNILCTPSKEHLFARRIRPARNDAHQTFCTSLGIILKCHTVFGARVVIDHA